MIGEGSSSEELKTKGSNPSSSSTSLNSKSPSNSGGNNNTNLSPKIPVAAENDTKRYERLLVVYSPLVGQRVTVFLYDGAVFEGTLDSFESEASKNEFALILRMSTMLRPGREVIDPSIKAGVTFELMNIRFDDMAELKSAGTASNNSGGIGTDSAISKKKGDFGKERELHRWLPEEGSTSGSQLSSLNATSSTWDQFATNEKLFGLKTDFNEELYTTKLDRNSAHIKAHEARAERIAKEIMMASSGGNVHLAEERGQSIQEGDEELLYGAVIRESKGSFQSMSNLPPGFTSSPTSTPAPASTLNPSAPEFKLNVDAPEFKPPSSSNKVTYYNQPRRNLMPNYYVGYGYPNQVPYYYVPPNVPVSVMGAMPVQVDSNSQYQSQSQSQSQPQSQSQSQSQLAASTQSEMNPNAADFVMPQYSPAPYYGGSGYNNNNNNGYNGYTGYNGYN